MKKLKFPALKWVPAMLTLSLMATACGRFSSAPRSPTAPAAAVENEVPLTLTVAAASDLQFAFSEIATQYEQVSGQAVTLVFGSSGQLAQQVENGAPFDLFAAADRAFIDSLADKGLVFTDTVRLYARGHLVLVVNRQSGAQALSLSDLLSSQIQNVAIANPEHAPYGRAAMQALQSAGLWENIQSKLVMGENVRQALQYVQSGDAQVGLVSRSIADVPEVTWTLVDDTLYAPLDQALAVVASSKQRAAAEEFIAFLGSEAGRQVMQRYGFGLPQDARPQPTTTPPP